MKPRKKNAGGNGGTALWGFEPGVVVWVDVSGSRFHVSLAKTG